VSRLPDEAYLGGRGLGLFPGRWWRLVNDHGARVNVAGAEEQTEKKEQSRHTILLISMLVRRDVVKG
jgi:hypothetical protein